jgi:chromosome segregation ATPase
MTIEATTTATAAQPATTQPDIERTRRPNPLNQAYDRKRADIDDKIGKLQKRFDALKQGDDLTSSSSAASGERGRVITELKEAREKMRGYREEAGNDMKALKEIQGQIKKQKDDVREQKDKLPYKSIPEIDARVAQLEEKIEVGSFSLSEEKQVLQDISKLKKTKKTLELLESGMSVDGRSSTANDLGTLKMKEEVYRQKMTTKFTLVDEQKVKVETLEKELERLDGGKQEAMKRQKARSAEMDKLRKEIDAAYDERRKLIEEHKEAKQRQREQWERNQARRAEEAKREEVEDQIWELEKKMRNLNPASGVDKKIDECVNVANYFGAIMKPSSSTTTTTTTTTTASKPVAVDGDFVVLKPKSDRDQVFIQTATATTASSSGSKKKQPSSSDTIGKLPLQILAALADLSLSVPKLESQVPDLLKSLEEKKKGFEGQRAGLLAGVKEQEAKLQAEIDALKAQLQYFYSLCFPP